MAVYKHGVYVTEQATDVYTLDRQASGITLVVGTSPIREAAYPAAPNEPVLCSTYNEAVAQLGYSTDTSKYTLCEAMEVLFGLYNVSPIVFVNVFDPATHKSVVTREQNLVTADHTVELLGDVLVESIVVETMTEIEDEEVWTIVPPVSKTYTLDKTVITLGDSFNMGAQVYVTYEKPNIDAVTAMYVTGAVDNVSGRSTGLELVSEIYSRFGYTVGTIIAPGFSHIAEVGLKMAAKAELVNGHFSAIAITDLDTSAAAGYAQAIGVKTSRGYESPYMITCYPAVKYGERVEHLSTHVAGIMNRLSIENDDIPYRSPSNQNIYMSGMCNFDGSSNYFGLEAANVLNGQGILTVTNFNGWKTWGNELSAFPTTSDPKDRWINVRAMFNFIKSRLTTGFWSTLDVPVTRRQIESILNSANIYLNGLTNRGALLGGRVEFNEDENSEDGLMSGQVNFHCYITPPSPAREINFVMQYDASYQSSVLEG